MARISQREAVKLRKRVDELEGALKRQRATWCQDYFGGVNIASVKWEPNDYVPIAIRTARKLDHAVVVIGDDSGHVRFMALPHYKSGL